jgi:Zn-dependent protease with chaperone function
MGFMKSLLLLIAIPIFGYAVGSWIIGDINAELTNQGVEAGISELCVPAVLVKAPELKGLCDEIAPTILMQQASVISGGVAILLLVSFIAFAAIAGKSRRKITNIFPPLVFISIFVLAALVLVQGAILTYGAYLAESYAIGRVHFILIGGIGLGAVVAGFGLIGSSFKMATKQAHSVLGLSLKKSEHPQLFSYVSSVADKLGARCPDHIVVGLEPNFYVTSADVKVLGSDTLLKGETLFLSLPLSRILTIEELTGVVGHELGHFRGEDTFYSMKFAPVYTGLSHAVSAIGSDKEGEGPGVASLPAYILLSYMIEVFHTNVSTISREREFEADRAGAEVAEGRALATSLLKISLYAHSWSNIQKDIIERLQQGKITRNMSLLFSNIVKYDVNKEKLPEVVASIAEEAISHPTDSHPATSARIKELGLDIETIDLDDLLLPRVSAIDIIDGHREIEEQLTTLQQQYYSAMGIQIPDQEQGEFGAKVLSAFGAHMVLADSNVEPEEIEQAEAIGLALTDSFDIVEFREYCHHPEDVPELDKLIDAAKEFDADLKNVIFDYISKIAGADDDVCEEEKVMLSKVKLGLDI